MEGWSLGDTRQEELADQIGLRGVVRKPGQSRPEPLVQELNKAIADALHSFQDQTKTWVTRESLPGGVVDMAAIDIVNAFGPRLWPFCTAPCSWLYEVQLHGENGLSLIHI